MLRVKIITSFLATASAITTWLGFRSMGSFSDIYFVREILPVIMAVGSLLTVVELYFTLFEWTPTTNKEKWSLRFATLIACVAIFFLSTVLSVIGLGGDSAMIYHMNKTVRDAEETLTTLSGQVEREEQMGASSGMLATNFEGLSQMEYEFGITTGFKGGGNVSLHLKSLSRTLRNLQNAVSSSLASRRNTIEDAKEEISKMREVIISDKSLASKIRLFGTKVTTLNQLFQRIEAGEVSRLVREVSKTLGSISATTSPTGESELAEAQKKARKDLNETVNSAKAIMSKFAETGIESSVEVSPLSVIDMGRAIFLYAYAIAPAWAAAMTFDYVPLLFRFMHAGVRRQRKEEEDRELQRQIAEL